MSRLSILRLAIGLGAGALSVAAAAQGIETGRKRIFISPMGEPFRATDTAPDPERTWFDGADANHDGTLTFAEFNADATRFFKVLDRKGDQEIDPEDIDYYENVLAPEVRSGGGARIIARKADGEGGANEHGTGKGPLYDAGTLGAARFSYFDLPEPVTAADRNFNRGIDPAEFARAADQRFRSLDRNGDNKLTWDELPHVRVKADVSRIGGKKRGGRDGGPGGGMGGGRREPMNP